MVNVFIKIGTKNFLLKATIIFSLCFKILKEFNMSSEVIHIVILESNDDRLGAIT